VTTANSKIQPSPRRRRLRRILRLALWLSLLTIAAGAALKYLIAPAVVRHMIRAGLPRYWDGHLEIDHVSVGFRSVQLEGIRLYDPAERLWLATDSVSISPGVQWNLQAGFRDVDLDATQIRLQYTEGRCEPPVRNVEELVEWLEEVTEIDILHADGTITLEEPGGTVYSVGPLELDIRRVEGGHRVRLLRHGGAGENVFLLDGWADWGRTAFDANATIRHRLTPADSRALKTILAVPVVDEAGFTLTADLRLKGRWTLPHTWRPAGTAAIRDAHLALGGVRLVEKLGGEFAVTSDANSITARANALTARIAGGSLVADGSATVLPGVSPRTHLPSAEVSYRGSLAVRGADLSPLVRAVTGAMGHRTSRESAARLGRLQLRYDVKGDGLSPSDLRGRGVLRLEKVDITRLPVLPAVMERLRGSVPAAIALADVEASVDSSGPRVTLREAKLAGALLAVDVERGGIIDLNEGTVDLYAVGLPLDRLPAVLHYVPVLEIFGFLQRSLTRVHVKGKWAGNGKVRVTVAPKPDARLGEKTRAFFLSAVRAGGNLPGHLIDRFRAMFTTLDLFGRDQASPPS
jgi:hypothetical protein